MRTPHPQQNILVNIVRRFKARNASPLLAVQERNLCKHILLKNTPADRIQIQINFLKRK